MAIILIGWILTLLHAVLLQPFYSTLWFKPVLSSHMFLYFPLPFHLLISKENHTHWYDIEILQSSWDFHLLLTHFRLTLPPIPLLSPSFYLQLRYLSWAIRRDLTVDIEQKIRDLVISFLCSGKTVELIHLWERIFKCICWEIHKYSLLLFKSLEFLAAKFLMFVCYYLVSNFQ